MDPPLCRRVIVAEKDPSLRARCADSLRHRGHEVIEVADGLSLLEALQIDTRESAPVDVVVAGVDIPGVSGVEVLEGLRAENWMTKMVLIARDAAAWAPRVEDVARLGAAVLLIAPFHVYDLADVVSQLIA